MLSKQRGTGGIVKGLGDDVGFLSYSRFLEFKEG